MPAIDVISDASVTLKWFHSEGEEEVAEARSLLDAHKARIAVVCVLDLTAYEVGNGLLRGRAKASAKQVSTVLDSLAEICPILRPSREEFRLAAKLASRHGLTVYDAAYAAVARQRNATLATLDRDLLDVGLGTRPSELAPQFASGPGTGEPR